jgi:DNA transformation protein and related proteins
MAVSPDYLDLVLEQLSPSLEVTPKRMFGGIGLYCGGLFFGLIDDDVLYFKVDDSNRADFEAAGSQAFMPPGAKASMNYFSVPGELLDDPDELGQWARRSVEVAMRAAKKAAKPAKKKR